MYKYKIDDCKKVVHTLHNSRLEWNRRLAMLCVVFKVWLCSWYLKTICYATVWICTEQHQHIDTSNCTMYSARITKTKLTCVTINDWEIMISIGKKWRLLKVSYSLMRLRHCRSYRNARRRPGLPWPFDRGNFHLSGNSSLQSPYLPVWGKDWKKDVSVASMCEWFKISKINYLKYMDLHLVTLSPWQGSESHLNLIVSAPPPVALAVSQVSCALNSSSSHPPIDLIEIWEDLLYFVISYLHRKFRTQKEASVV